MARRRTNGERASVAAPPDAEPATAPPESPQAPPIAVPAQNIDSPIAAVPWSQVTRQQLAALMGVHPDSVTDYTRGGMPVITRGGRGKESAYDAIACLEWWRDQQGHNQKEQAQARAANASAELNELKLKEKAGELWPKAQIAIAGQAVIKQVATTIRSLPKRMTQAGLIQRAQEPAVAQLCHDTLRDLTTWRPVPVK